MPAQSPHPIVPGQKGFTTYRQDPRGLAPVALGHYDFGKAEVLQTREDKADADGRYRREVLLHTDFKYPYVRMVLHMQQTASGKEQCLQDRAMVADHVVVRVCDGIDRQTLAAALRGTAWKIRRAMRAPDHFLIEGYPVDLDLAERVLDWCQKHPELVEAADYDDLVYLTETIPNDGLFADLWAFKNTGQEGGTVGADMEATLGWDYARNASNVIVGVVDTGVDYDHPDLAANMWTNAHEIPDNEVDDDHNGFTDDVYGFDFCNDDGDPDDDHFHGTHVAGTIGAVGNNGYGVVGVCWHVRLMALKFLSSSGSGAGSDAIDAIYYATDNGVNVLNNSWGGGGYNQLLYDAIEYAGASNVLFVAAAGNDGVSLDQYVHYPCSYSNENILGVAATDRQDMRAYFSNYGTNDVDVAAPGVSILSTFPVWHGLGPFYAISGTSMATPQVAGLAALLLGTGPQVVTNLKATIMNTVEPLDSMQGLVKTGGRVNVLQAVMANRQLTLDAESYFYNDWCNVFMRNSSATSPTVVFTTAGGDREDLALDEVDGLLACYTNRIWLTPSASPVPGNSMLEVVEGDTFTAVYSNAAEPFILQDSASVSVQLDITVPETFVLVSNEVSTYTMEGVNNGNVCVSMVVSNEQTGEFHFFAATNDWTAPTITVTDYESLIRVSGTNIYGSFDEETVRVTRRGPTGTNYISNSGSDEWPYLSWATAGTNPARVAMAAADGNTILISNGTYGITEAVAPPAGVYILGLQGPENTVIEQQGNSRCFQLEGAGTIVEGITVSGGNAYRGGGFNITAEAVLTNCIIKNNDAHEGGAVAATGGVQLLSCTMISNTAYVGAGVFLEGTGTVRDCDLIGNTAERSGGGAFLYDAIRMEDCRIAHNEAEEYAVGGVVCYNQSQMHGCSVESNSGAQLAGGLYILDDAVVSNCTIRGNEVWLHYNGSGLGGGVYILNGTLTHSLIESNTACYAGGGLYTYGLPEWVPNRLWDGGINTHCIIRGNEAEWGGGVLLNQEGLIRNCLVTRNLATDQGLDYTCHGGGMHTFGGTVYNCTIADNHADDFAGGLFCYQNLTPRSMIANCIILNNTALSSPEYRIDDDYGTIEADLRYCCSTPAIPGTNNIVADHVFIRSGDTPYALMPGADCIDVGENTWVSENETDLSGQSRIFNVVVDMGAYEFNPSSLSCGFSLTNREGVLPHEVLITGQAAGGSGNYYYMWDLDGDDVTDYAGYGLHTVTARYTEAGAYDIRLSVSNAMGETATLVRSNAVNTGPADLYVAAAGSHTSPFTNWTAAATNIQAALDVAVLGSTVWITNGTYLLREELSITNALDVVGLHGADATILDGQHTSRCVHVKQVAATLSGVTIQHGYTQGKELRGLFDHLYEGGGGVCLREGGTLVDCKLIDNVTASNAAGGGAYLYRGGLLDRCEIRGNSADGAGGGVALYYGGDNGGVIRSCLLTENETHVGDWTKGGGGVYAEHGGAVRNCTIVNNYSRRIGGGFRFYSYSSYEGGCRMENSICVSNWYLNGRTNNIISTYEPEFIRYSCLSTASASMTSGTVITNDPLFVDPDNGDYRLMPDSPCRDSGENQAWMTSALDAAGHPRIAYAVVDRGALEVPGTLDCFIRAEPACGIIPMTGTLTAVISGTNLVDVYYRWDVEDDGSEEYTGLSNAVVNHVFTNAGLFTVALTISNQAGETASCTATGIVQTEAFGDLICDVPAGSVWTAGVSYTVQFTARLPSGDTMQCFDRACTLSVKDQPELDVLPAAPLQFSDGVWSGEVAVLGSAESCVLLVDDGFGHTGTSQIFSVQTGPATQFGFDDISSPQQSGAAFDATVSALDANGYVCTGYTNTAMLTAWSFNTNDEYSTLGDGTVASEYPLDTMNYARRLQSLYMAEDIGRPLQIRSLALEVSARPGTVLGNWTIRLKHTTNAYYDLSSGWESEGWTVVYTNNEQITETGWYTFEFQTPFAYNGTSNLMVDFSFRHNVPYSYGGRVYGTSHAEYRSLQASGGGHPSGWPTNGYNPSPGINTWTPNIRFGDTPEAVSFLPAAPVTFEQGQWTGSVTVQQSGTNVYILAEDDDGLSGRSDLIQLDTVALEVKSAFGGAEPASGFHYYVPGATVTCRVVNSPVVQDTTQWVCQGWAGSGSMSDDPSGGTNTGPVVLNEDSTLTWQWTTNYWLNITNEAGSISVSNGWYAGGSTVIADVTPETGYEFDRWAGDTAGCTINGSEISIPMDRARFVEAMFLHTYYVNDSATNLDMWCTAVGSDTNSGQSPAFPKASVQDVIETYDLEPGDTVRIDTGLYVMNTNIHVEYPDAGSAEAPLRFECSPYGVEFDRNNTNYYDSKVWRIYKASGVSLCTVLPTNETGIPVQWARLRHGKDGLYLGFGDDLTIERLDISDCAEDGVELVYGDDIILRNLLVHHHGEKGIYVRSGCYNPTIENCTVADNRDEQLYMIGDHDLALLNNIMRADGSGKSVLVLEQQNATYSSDYNCFSITNGAVMGEVAGALCSTFADWRSMMNTDTHSLNTDPLFAAPGQHDYHLQSTSGRYTSGAWVVDSLHSPCIDAGDTNTAVGTEPEPNGNRANMGAYGRTGQASMTTTNRSLILLQPAGGEYYADRNDDITVYWQYAGEAWLPGDTLTIAYSPDEGATWITCATNVHYETYAYTWNVAALPTLPLYRMRISCNRDPAIWDQSDANFRIGSNMVCYVNDNSRSNDCWVTTLGNNSLDGLSVSTPRASVQSVLDTYDLQPGDRVRIDTGQYALTSDIEIGKQDSGDAWNMLIFECSPFGVTFDRGNAASTARSWYFNDCEYVCLQTAVSTNLSTTGQHMAALTGGGCGVYLYYTLNCRIDRVDTSDNSYDGIQFYHSMDGCYRNILAHDNGRYGIYVDRYSDDTRVENCTLAENRVRQLRVDTYANGLIMSNCILQTSQTNDCLVQSYAHAYLSDVNRNIYDPGAFSKIGEVNGIVYSNLTAWQAGTGQDADSRSIDPLFANAAQGDFHLKSQAGRFSNGVWVVDAVHSPAIDAGPEGCTDPAEPAPNGNRINFGAYGGTEWASRSRYATVCHFHVESPLDECTPSTGIYYLERGTNIAAWVNTATQFVGVLATQYVCSGWNLSGICDTNGAGTGTGTNLALVLTNDSTLSWNWTENYRLELTAGDHGQIVQTSAWHEKDSTLTVDAVPDIYYHFGGWSGDIVTNTASVLITMSRPLALDAAFSANLTTNTQTPEWWLASFGITSNFCAHVLEDPDGDTFFTWEEYISDTIPTNAASHLPPAMLENDGTNRYVVIDPVSSNRVYRCWGAATLGRHTDWVLQGTQQHTSAIYFMTTNDLQGFFRTGVSLPE